MSIISTKLQKYTKPVCFFKSISDSRERTPNNPRAISVRVLIPKPCINLMQNLCARSS